MVHPLKGLRARFAEGTPSFTCWLLLQDKNGFNRNDAAGIAVGESALLKGECIVCKAHPRLHSFTARRDDDLTRDPACIVAGKERGCQSNIFRLSNPAKGSFPFLLLSERSPIEPRSA